MMRITIDINGIETKSVITVRNITDGGLSNTRENTYNIWVDGRDTGKTVTHWRKDGFLDLTKKVINLLS